MAKANLHAAICLSVLLPRNGAARQARLCLLPRQGGFITRPYPFTRRGFRLALGACRM